MKKWGIWVYILVGVGIVGGVILASIYEVRWVSDGLTAIGLILTLGGIYINKKKILNVEEISDKTQQAVAENRQEIRNYLVLADVSRLIEVFDLLIYMIQQQDYRSALYPISQLKDNLRRVYITRFTIVNNSTGESAIEESDESKKLKDTIEDLHIDWQNLSEEVGNTRKGSKLRPNVVLQHLSDGKNVLIDIEGALINTKK